MKSGTDRGCAATVTLLLSWDALPRSEGQYCRRCIAYAESGTGLQRVVLSLVLGAMQSPVLSSCLMLHVPYALSGTELWYGAARGNGGSCDRGRVEVAITLVQL